MPTAIDVAKTHGLVNAATAWHASQIVGVPFWATCAFLEQESGGHNVYGHDPGWFCGAGDVTKANYLRYKAGRDHHNAQGVGPMQLTWPGFQDQADAAGGCWIPLHNITVGLRVLKGYVDGGKSWHAAAAAYNGSEAYAVQMESRFDRWRKALDGATSGGHVTSNGTEPHRKGNGNSNGGRASGRWARQEYFQTGMFITRGMAQALERIRVLSGETQAITMYQGSFHRGTTASAQTHWGADVVDISPYNLAARARAAAEVGMIMFHRPAIAGLWQEHCHCILRPSPDELAKSVAQHGRLNYQAAEQIHDWDKRLNGLADHSSYTAGPWYECRPFVWHPNYGKAASPPHPPVSFPLFDNAQHALSDYIRTLQEIVKAHPNMPQPASDLAAAHSRLSYYRGFNTKGAS